MKIKSRFKDYYDYVAHAYGGGDERVTYVREPLQDELTTIIVNGNIDFYSPPIDELKTRTKYLVVNGKVYVLVSVKNEMGMYDPYQLFTEKNFKDRVDSLSVRYRWTMFPQKNTVKQWEKYFAFESKVVTEISKMIKQPVFIIDSIENRWKEQQTRVAIDKNIPILSEYGLNHYIQPEQLYQDIAYYVSNKMVTSPDLEVHDNMTDKEKIVQHGFDLKQSFRHRK